MSELALSVEELRKIEPRFRALKEAPIHYGTGSEPLAWHSNAVGERDDIVLGGGFARTRDEARRIALAETIERATFRYLKGSEHRQAFGLDQYPTSCGFAAGFDSEQTRMRSLCEAIERWARALWIDQHFVLTPTDRQTIGESALLKFFASQFEDVRAYRQSFTVFDPIKKLPLKLQLGVVLGLTAQGAFPGSRVCGERELPWEHALLEAWRHHHIFSSGGLPDLPENSFLHRIAHFGTRKELALAQIERANRYDWPTPEVVVQRCYEALPGKAYVWRTICGGYKGWEKGSIERFVF